MTDNLGTDRVFEGIIRPIDIVYIQRTARGRWAAGAARCAGVVKSLELCVYTARSDTCPTLTFENGQR